MRVSVTVLGRCAWSLPATAFLLLFTLTSFSCQDSHYADSLQTVLLNRPPGMSVQEGEIALRDGDERKVYYKIPFQAPPNLVVVEIRQAWFKDKGYSKSDFKFLQQEAAYFKIQNDHAEAHLGSWATIKWRAEGIRSEKPSPPEQQGGGDRPAKMPNSSKPATPANPH